MGRKSCRKQRKEQLVPQAAVATPLPPLPPGSPPSREIWDWLVHPEGNFAFDLPCVISTLCLRDGERWADWEKQHNPASVRDLTMVVLGYLAADMGGIPPRYGQHAVRLQKASIISSFRTKVTPMSIEVVPGRELREVFRGFIELSGISPSVPHSFVLASFVAGDHTEPFPGLDQLSQIKAGEAFVAGDHTEPFPGLDQLSQIKAGEVNRIKHCWPID
ncbi:UNVERIFIED_CONTAM: hypothetical protein FKN15_044390 [Acipenser sinensis]